MSLAEFARLPITTQTNLLIAVAVSEAMRYWIPMDAADRAHDSLDDVVWAAVVGATRMFEAGPYAPQAEPSYERLIAAVPDHWVALNPPDGQHSDA